MVDLKADCKRKYENVLRKCGTQEENIEYEWQCKKFTERTPKIENLLKSDPIKLLKVKEIIEIPTCKA